MSENKDLFTWHLDLDKNNENWAYADAIFTDIELDKIIEIGLDPKYAKHEQARIGGDNGGDDPGIIDKSTRKGYVSWFRTPYKENHWIFQKLTQSVLEINNKFFNYELKYIESLQFSIYNENDEDFYNKHIDMGYASVGTRKLSFSLQLSKPEDYEGGDLVLHFHKDPTYMPRKRGTCLFFPSFTLHEVTPVTKGTRYSLVGWVIGPRFK